MLSIIIPAKNEEKNLPLFLESIKRQDFSDYEIIVADADSADKTLKIAKKYGCRISAGGLPAKGRNEGAKIAKGDILLFMDSDNLLPKGFIKNLLGAFEKRKLDVASFPIFPDGNILDESIYSMYNNFVRLTQGFLAFATNSVLVRRKIFEKIGGFDELVKIGEDHDFARRASKVGKFGFVETDPVLTSSRRLEREGRLKTYLKYFFSGIHFIILGGIKSDIYQYKFDGLPSREISECPAGQIKKISKKFSIRNSSTGLEKQKR